MQCGQEQCALNDADLHEDCVHARMLGQVPCLLLDEGLKGGGARVADVGVVQEGERLLQVVPLLLIAAGGEHLQEHSPSACAQTMQLISQLQRPPRSAVLHSTANTSLE